jgi:hypothetical protein
LTIKILTSPCVGGPNLSHEVVDELFARCPELFDEPHQVSAFFPEGEDRSAPHLAALLANTIIRDELIYCLDTSSQKFRTCSWLVEKVEKDGGDSVVPVGSTTRLKIVEIPDGVEWYVYSNDDGSESINEKHRVWS